MQAKLENLQNFGDMQVDVSLTRTDTYAVYRVTFKNAPHNLPQLRVKDHNVLTVPTASSQVEVQKIIATTGEFTVTAYGRTTSAIVAGDPEFEMKLSNILSFVPSIVYNAGVGSWTITFPRVAGNADEMVINIPRGIVSDAGISTVFDGQLPSITVRTVRQARSISGHFKLSVGKYQTPPLAHDASSSAVKFALLGLNSVGENINVIRSAVSIVGGYKWLVIFSSEHPEGHPNILVDGSGLTAVGVGMSNTVLQVGGSHGRIHLPRIDGLALTGMAHASSLNGIGVYGATVSVKGSLQSLNHALSLLEYIPDYSWSGSVKVFVTVNDHGFTGSGGAKTSTAKLSIHVKARNVAPHIVVPVSYQNDTLGLETNEDSPLPISSFKIYDSDTGQEGQLTVSIWSEHGTVRFGEKSAHYTAEFSGTAVDVNTTLASLIYIPPAHFSGLESLHVRVKDEADAVAHQTFMVLVHAINDAPEIFLETTHFSVAEDGSVGITGISIIDNDFQSQDFNDALVMLEFRVSVSKGQLEISTYDGLGGIVFVDNAVKDDTARNSSLTFRGSLIEANAALASLSYQGNPHFHGEDTIVVFVNDLGNFGTGGNRNDTQTISITVNAKNDQPRVLVSSKKIHVKEDNEVIIHDLSIHDIDFRPADDNDILRIVVTTEHGTFTLTRTEGLMYDAGTGKQDTFLNFTGNAEDINRALAESVFRPSQNWNSVHYGVARIHVVVIDPSNDIHEDEIIFVVEAVNDGPVLLVPGQRLNSDYTKNPNSYDDDLSRVIDSIDTIVSSEDMLVDIVGVSIRDVDAQEDIDNNGYVWVTVEATNGTVWLTKDVSGIHRFVIGNGENDTVVSFLAEVDVANAALRELKYQGTRNFYGLCGIKLSVNDTGNTGEGGAKTITQYIPISLAPINDEPIINLPADSTLSVMEDHELVLRGLSVYDVDHNETDLVEITISAEHGSVSLTRIIDLTFEEGDGLLDGYMRLRGTLRNLNRALDECVYQPDPHWNTYFKMTDTVEITLNDLDLSGLPGSGPHFKVTKVMYIEVEPENDMPIVHVPGDHRVYRYDGHYDVASVDTIVCDEDDPIIIRNVKVEDYDAMESPGALLEFSIRTENGTFSIDRTNGLTIISGSGVNDTGFIAKGTLAHVNDALKAIVYVGMPDFNGHDVMTFRVNDLGNTGNGTALRDERSIPLRIDPINDIPVWVTPTGTIAVSEDSSVVLSGISVHDIDDIVGDAASPDYVRTVLITADHGVVSLTRIANLVFEIGTGVQEKRIRCRGRLQDINRALRDLEYYPDPDFTTERIGEARDSIHFYIDDNGMIGRGGNQTATTVVNIQNVVGKNDPPIVIVPGGTYVKIPCEDEPATSRHAPVHRQCDRIVMVDMISIPEDVAFPIFNISIFDHDAMDVYGGVIEVSLGVLHGTISLSAIQGLHFLRGTGKNDARNVTFRGDLASVNNALDGVTYQGDADYYGRDNFTVYANDLGNSGQGGALSDMQIIPLNVTAVNDAPAWSTLDINCTSGKHGVRRRVRDFKGYFADEDVTIELPVQVVDVDSGNGEIEVTIAPDVGVVSISSSYVDRLTFIGLTVVEGLQLNDSVNSRQMHFSGRTFDVNEALAGLRYTSASNWHSSGRDADNVTITVNDRGSLGSGGALFSKHVMNIFVREVNDAPVVSVPRGMLFVDEDRRLLVDEVSVFDVDADDGFDILEVSVQATHGVVSVSAFFEDDYQSNETKERNTELKEPGEDLLHLDFRVGDGVEDDTLTFVGTVKRINDALKHLSYKGKPNFNGFDTITVTANDMGQYKSSGLECKHTMGINVTVLAVNDAPVITVPVTEGHTTLFRLAEDLELRVQGTRYHGKPHVPSRYVYQSGYELFRSEGSRPDADWPNWRGRLVADIWPGRKASSPRYFQVFSNALYFSADDGVHGRELWRTSHDILQQDQYATELVKDIFPGSRGSNPTWLTTMGGKLYFASNGVDTTWMNFDDSCGGFRQSSVNAAVHYAVSNSTTWRPDYVYDCPAGYHWADTEEGLGMVEKGNDGAHPGGTSTLKGKPTYYNQCGWNGYDFEGARRRLFRFSDSHLTGSYKSAGTQEDAEIIVTNFQTSEFAGIVCVRGQDEAEIDNSRCRIQQVRQTARMPDLPVRPCYIRGGNELWVSDSTQNGTYRVADIRPGVGSADPAFLVSHDPSGFMFFAATAEPDGRELWRTDGTQAGTQLIEDINTGERSSNPKYLTLNDTSESSVPLVYFQAENREWGEELWISDGVIGTYGDNAAGSGSGTKLVKDIQAGQVGSKPHSLLMLDGVLLFIADDGVHGEELWRSQGIALNTYMVRDICPGTEGSKSSQLTAYNGVAYFTADDCTFGNELWRSDGTLSGTVLLKDLCVGACSGFPNFFTRFTPPVVNGVEELYFSANMGVDGAQLWISDGTKDGTRRAFQHIKPDIDIDEASHHLDFPSELGVYHGSLYWSGNEGRADIELPRGGVGGGHMSMSAGLNNAIVVEDVDIGENTFDVKLSCRKGQLSLATSAGLAFSDGDGVLDRSMHFTANAINLNEAFRWIQYRALPNENGEDEILVRVNDTAFSGAYDVWEESSNAIRIWIEEKNDPPTIDRAPHNPDMWFAPGTGTGTGQPKSDTVTLGALSVLDGFTVNDIDMGPLDVVRVDLEALYGKITLNSIDGLSFGGQRGMGTGIANRVMSFTGTLNDVNEALFLLRYLCTAEDGCLGTDSTGGEKIVIRVRDVDSSGNFETLTAMKTIEVKVIEPSSTMM
jgi:ELWxxDGT repeat protein